MGRIAAGDRRAFAELFDRHAPLVLGVLTRMLRRREEAEEVLQECFLQAWRRAASYRPEGATPRGWLLMLGRSRALDRIRASQAHIERESATAPPAETPPVGTRALEAAEAGRQVSTALGRLPQEQRRCIELAFFEGLSHSQIAERLREPLGTIKSRIALGMRKLRSAMEPAR
jgi:RNA polymerase sigma-70 factor, ECF subfamily